MPTRPFLVHDLLRTAARDGARCALVAGSSRIDYRELARRSALEAHRFAAAGVGRGDRVVLVLENSIGFATAFFGALSCGAIVVPLNPRTPRARLEFIVEDCGPALVVVPAARQAELGATFNGPGRPTLLGELPKEAQSAPADEPLPGVAVIDVDPALLIYTSGSTGRPKGVLLSHLNVLAAAGSIQAYLQLEADDVILCALPLSFDYGLYQLLLAVQVGASVVLEDGLSYPARVLKRLEEERITVLPGVPTLFGVLLRLSGFSREHLPCLRMLTNTGARLSVRTIQEIRTRFRAARVFSMYGLTECKRVSYLPPEQLDTRPDSIGRGMANQELWLEDAEGRRLPWGSEGELVVRGSHVMLGYWRRPEETRACLRLDPATGERVLRTGDLFRSDAEGYLYFVARRDDVIKSRGQKVSPREVEDVIAELPGVTEVAVVGLPDDLHGQIVKAFVAASQDHGYSATTILAHCRTRLEPHMVPDEVEICARLPQQENGKIDRRLLVQSRPAETD